MAIGNSYYRITKKTSLVALTRDYQKTGCYYGAAQVLRAKRAAVIASRGDEIHDLCGGRFLVCKNGAVHELATHEEGDFMLSVGAPISVQGEAIQKPKLNPTSYRQ